MTQQDEAAIAPGRPERYRYRPGDLLRVRLGPIANRGMSIAHTPEGQAVFVAFGAEGELVSAVIDTVHKDRLTAHVVEVHEASSARVQPRCPYFSICGGCNYQHLAYEEQLRVKREVVRDTLRRIGRFETVAVPETVPSPSPWSYRNQMRLSTNRWGDVGLTRRNSHDVIPLQVCHIAEQAIRDALPELRGKGAGLHQIVLRTGTNSGAMLIAPNLAERGCRLASGQEVLTETVAGQTFQISPSAFFQVNTRQAQVMIELARERLELAADDVLADLYAGVGFFSKLLAGSCREVYAIEISPQAAVDAAVNLAGLDNVHYLAAAVETALPELSARPNKVLLDPSREGCAPPALAALVALAPQRIVYISCDVATLGRDLRRLVDGGFTLLEVLPIDMFPQTHHVECIATLILDEASAGGESALAERLGGTPPAATPADPVDV